MNRVVCLLAGHVVLALGVWLSTWLQVTVQRRGGKSNEILKCMQRDAENVIKPEVALNCSEALQDLRRNVSITCIYRWTKGDCVAGVAGAPADEGRESKEQLERRVGCKLKLSKQECAGQIAKPEEEKRSRNARKKRREMPRNKNQTRSGSSFLECWCFFLSRRL